MVGLDGASVDEIADGGAQAALVAHRAEHIVEHGGDGRLSVGAGHANEFQPSRRVIVELGSRFAYSVFRVGHADVGNARHGVGGEGFGLEYGLGSLGNGLGDVGVPIGLCSFHGHEKVAVFHLARIHVHA